MGAAPGIRQHVDFRRFAPAFPAIVPVHGPGHQFTVDIGADDFKHRHRRQGSRFADALFTALFKDAGLLHLAQHFF